MIRYHQHSTNKDRWYVSADNNERRKLKRDGWVPVPYNQVPPTIIRSKALGTWFKAMEPIGQDLYHIRVQYIHEGLAYRDMRRGEPMS